MTLHVNFGILYFSLKISSMKPLVSIASINLTAADIDFGYSMCETLFSKHLYVSFNYHNNPGKIPFPHFRGEDIEAQRGNVTYPGHPADNLSQISKPGSLSQTLPV